MSYNGSGTFSINTAGQPVITGTVISSTAFNALTADLATGLSTAITKDGQTTTTARVPFAQGINSTLTTDATSTTTGSIITAGGISTQKALFVGTTSNFAGTMTAAAANFSGNLSVVNSGATASISIGSASNSFHQQINFLNSVSAVSGSIDYYPNSGLLTISPSVSTTFTGLVGIGMTPSNVLDITQNQNASSVVRILNTNAGAASQTNFQAYNGTDIAIFGVLGTGYTTSGVAVANNTLLTNSGGASVSDIAVYSTRNILFATGNSSVEKARFSTGGDFMVGTTTTAPGTFSGNVFIAGGGVRVSDGGNISYFNLTSASGIHMNFYTTAGTVPAGNISSSGATTSYNTSSDYRMKTNVQPMTGGLAIISALKPVTYDWICDKSAGEGFIAHELQSVIPLAVTGEKDAVNKDDRISPQAVDFGKIVVHLVAAIQELTTRLAALENK